MLTLLGYVFKFIFESQNSSNWFEAIATFLAVLVALNKKARITAYIKKDKGYKLHINKLYYLPDSVKIIKCGLIFYKNRLQNFNVKRNYFNNLENFQYINSNKVFNISPFIATVIDDSINDPYINNHVPLYKRVKITSKVCPFIMCFKDIHHRYYVLNYPSNNCKSYNWFNFRVKELNEYIRKEYDLIILGKMDGENYEKDVRKEIITNSKVLKLLSYKIGFLLGYKNEFKKRNNIGISYKKVKHIYSKYINS